MRLTTVSERPPFAYLRFEIPAEALEVDLAAGILGLILSDGEPDLLLEPRLWRSLRCDLLEPQPDDAASLLRVRVHRSVFNGPTFRDLRQRTGQVNWWLDQSFVDFNSPKAEAFLRFIGA
jgi:hypothetical protein